jgi:hypothetical protein
LIHAWIIPGGGKPAHFSMKSGDYRPLSQALKRLEKKDRLIILLNREALKWIREDPAGLREIPASMALSMEEASTWAVEDNRRQIRSILYVEKGKKGVMSLPSDIREYEKDEIDIAACDIIVDSMNSPAFNTRLSLKQELDRPCSFQMYQTRIPS